MADILHLRCHHCGEELYNRAWPYCPQCNFQLCYRSLPILLGMLFGLTLPAPARAMAVRSDFQPISGYDEEPCIMVDYLSRKRLRGRASAYEEELCIMVPY